MPDWPSLPATDALFTAVFSLFVFALLVLAVIIIVWAIRHDRAGRAAWLDRRKSPVGGPDEPARTNGAARADGSLRRKGSP